MTDQKELERASFAELNAEWGSTGYYNSRKCAVGIVTEWYQEGPETLIDASPEDIQDELDEYGLTMKTINGERLVPVDQEVLDDAIKWFWTEAILDDPIPAWALQAALSHLVESGAIDASGKGQTWLANQLGRTPRSVRMWIDGSRNCSGLTAKAVREVIEEAMI